MDDMKDKFKGFMKKVNTQMSSSSSGKFKGQGRVLGSSSSGPKNPNLTRPSQSVNPNSNQNPSSVQSKPLPQKNSPVSDPRPTSIDGQNGSNSNPDSKKDRPSKDGFDPFDSFITSGERNKNGYSLNVFECPICGSGFTSEEDVSIHIESCIVAKTIQNLERESLVQATMVMTLRKRVPSIAPQSESDSETPPKKKKTQKNSKSTKRRETYSSSESEFNSNSDSEKENERSIEYEKIREQRIRENRERMEKLGIFTLSSQVFNGNQKVARRKNPPPQKKRYPPLYPRVRDRSYDYARRSSRLKEMETEKSLKEMGISIPEDWTTEVYTEEDEKLLGDCETIWSLELEADGLDEDGDRLYDLERPPCHQCRQRRAGKFTYCGKCRTPHGQICGECLYTRYGENVLEARQNPTWSCPACRGMCNCSRCRRTKGWDPINIPHSKVIESGFKSVAHYIILTRRVGATPKELNDGAEVVDLTPEEIAAAPRDEGSDYSAEWSGAESDDSDSEDETKGDKNNEEQPDKNDEEQLEENQVASAAKSIEAAVATDRDEVL